MSRTSGLSIKEKRTALEVTIANQRLRAGGGTGVGRTSCNSLVDSPTNTSTRHLFADLLRKGTHAIKNDPDHVAGMILTQQQREETPGQAGDPASGNVRDGGELCDFDLPVRRMRTTSCGRLKILLSPTCVRRQSC